MTTIAAPIQNAGRTRSVPSLIGHQVGYDLRGYTRNLQGLFSTLLLPVLFLVIFASVFGHGRVAVPGGTISVAAFYVPGIITLGIISATFNNLVISVVGTREAGILKRRRATPMSAPSLIAARGLVAILIALAITGVLIALGAAYGAGVPLAHIPALLLTVVVASLAFCSLGFALASVIRSRDAAMPVVMLITLPLYFISGVFVATSVLPQWVLRIAAFFPVRHAEAALLAAFNPYAAGAAFRWHDLGVLALWGGYGLLVARRRFRWLPSNQ